MALLVVGGCYASHELETDGGAPGGDAGVVRRSHRLSHDIDGDRFDDVVVAAIGDPDPAFVYRGSASRSFGAPTILRAPASATGTFALSIAFAGDVNGDGHADVLVGSGPTRTYLFLGSATGLLPSPSSILMEAGTDRTLCVGAGDVNGDGYDDVVAADYELRRANVYLGSATGLAALPAVSLGADVPPDAPFFANAISTAGDVNGDGYDDVVTGSDFAPLGGVATAYVYLGEPGGLRPTADAVLTGMGDDYFGSSVAGVGDVNRDGFDDVVVSAPGGGVAYLYLGSGGGLLTTPAAVLTAMAADDHFGEWAIASAGDVNHDGYDDVIIASVNRYEGYVRLYLGGEAGITDADAVTLTGSRDPYNPTRFFGGSLAAGDLDADGFSDILIAGHDDVGPTGHVFVYFGSATGAFEMPSYVIDGPDSDMHFAVTVGSVD